MAQRFIEMVGLKGFEDRFPSALSGDMRQPVSIARVFRAHAGRGHEPTRCLLLRTPAFGHHRRMDCCWIDTHCHLDAPEFSIDVQEVRARAALNGVVACVLPAIAAARFGATRALARRLGDAYALGIHPLRASQAADAELEQLEQALVRDRDDPRLVAVGEIGLDCYALDARRQETFYREQLRLARRHGLPVLLHVRRSADQLIKGLRETPVAGGIVHAFNGSPQQARAFIALGFKLGFGGAATFEHAQRLRRLAAELPLDALVLETDAPDMPPQWLYRSARQRAAGAPQGRNEPAELPRIAQTLATLRGMSPAELAEATTRNALSALPRLARVVRHDVAASADKAWPEH